MLKNIVNSFLIAIIFLGVPQSFAQTDYQRALKLYQQVVSGQKELEDLSAEEKRSVVIVHHALSGYASNIEGHNFSLRDVERKCEVYKYSDSYGDVECRGSSLRAIERKCEAYFYESQAGELECRGREFRDIERQCSVSMYSGNYGEISC